MFTVLILNRNVTIDCATLKWRSSQNINKLADKKYDMFWFDML